MRARRLTPEEVVTVLTLAERGLSNRTIAKQLGITEGTVRYQRNKAQRDLPDGRAKVFKAAEMADVIEHWINLRQDRDRPINIKELYESLVEEHHYDGSYKSVLRYVRANYPKPKIRTWRRVETPPGAQSQTDWGEFPRVNVANDIIDLHAFIMVFSHSRMTAIVWSRAEKLLDWLTCHNLAYQRLGAVPAVNRIDNLKTGIVQGAGATGVVHPVYAAYARQLGFHVDACPPRAGNAKGKVEAKVRLVRLRFNPRSRPFDSIEHLQHWTDQRVSDWASNALCPITGRTVYDSWQRELEAMPDLPLLPEPFDLITTRTVHRDCTVRFEGRTYTVPFAFAGQSVEIRGCAQSVDIWAAGRKIASYPRHTEARLLVDPRCYEGKDTDRVTAPPPLGKMGERLAELYAMPVEQRPLDLYAALSEVAR